MQAAAQQRAHCTSARIASSKVTYTTVRRGCSTSTVLQPAPSSLLPADLKLKLMGANPMLRERLLGELGAGDCRLPPAHAGLSAHPQAVAMPKSGGSTCRRLPKWRGDCFTSAVRLRWRSDGLSESCSLTARTAYLQGSAGEPALAHRRRRRHSQPAAAAVAAPPRCARGWACRARSAGLLGRPHRHPP